MEKGNDNYSDLAGDIEIDAIKISGTKFNFGKQKLKLIHDKYAKKNCIRNNMEIKLKKEVYKINGDCTMKLLYIDP